MMFLPCNLYFVLHFILYLLGKDMMVLWMYYPESVYILEIYFDSFGTILFLFHVFYFDVYLTLTGDTLLAVWFEN